jgi:hypothetical protein
MDREDLVTRAKRPVAWWPPKAGDLLRHATTHGAGAGRIKRVEALLHVLAVFNHDGCTRIVTAEWFPTKRRWSYQVRDEVEAFYGAIWPEGEPRPEAP